MGEASGRRMVKTVGANGQISLGKRYAGREVLVEETEPGVWIVRTATVVPDTERWLLEPKTRADLRRALDWAGRNPPSDALPPDLPTRPDHDD